MPADKGSDIGALSVSDFVALANQTFDYVFPGVVIQGELANFRISKNKWVYFDLKDARCSVKFFGTVHQLPGPLQDGMLLAVRGTPHLHDIYGFSVNVMTITLSGEGTIRKAAELLFAKLQAEGLFDAERKRALPYPPSNIGLITSAQSAAYADFVKILSARWGGVTIRLIDVQVQGDAAPAQLVAAIEQFNGLAEPPEVLVLIRGGGSADDLAAFSTEQVTRAIAASRIPTLVAIGHEIDESMAELAADKRASTPSNAAELMVPDKQVARALLAEAGLQIGRSGANIVRAAREQLGDKREDVQSVIEDIMTNERRKIISSHQLLKALDPHAILRRGYAIVRSNGYGVRSVTEVSAGSRLTLQLSDGEIESTTNEIRRKDA